MVQTCSFQIQFKLTNLAILYEAWWPHSHNRLGLFHKNTSRMCNTCKLAEKPCFSFPALPVVVAVNTNMASLNCYGLKGLKIYFFHSKPQMLLIESLFFLSRLFSFLFFLHIKHSAANSEKVCLWLLSLSAWWLYVGGRRRGVCSRRCVCEWVKRKIRS